MAAMDLQREMFPSTVKDFVRTVVRGLQGGTDCISAKEHVSLSV